MCEKLCILGCHNFHQEVVAAIQSEGWDDVTAVEFPSRCGHPPIDWDELRRLLPDASCGQLVVLGRACLNTLEKPPADFPPTRIITVEQCFHLVAPRQLVDDAISGGAYLITPGWLADWRSQLQKLGFAPDQASEFFHEFATELLLLDTGIAADSEVQLAELGKAVKLPTRRIGVGLDSLRLRLALLVLEWRREQDQRSTREKARRLAGEQADLVAAMDMLTRLAKTQQEPEAIAAINELFQMLFAPKALHYLRVENNIPNPMHAIPANMLEAMRNLRDDYALTADGYGFLLRIGQPDRVLGLIAIDGLAFPEYRDRYLNMALAVTGVCGLAIENARNQRRLLEAEKMSSLAVLVAGVAHEINTPLGVGLTAASTLQRQGRMLAQRFAEHSMTQSDLQRYLDTAGSSSSLILENLQRIAHLIDAFRQVAVNDGTADKQTFRMLDNLYDVIRSLQDHLPTERIALNIDCDPALEITSQRGDWTSIFINLIGNSLKHGFKGREHGIIDIHIARIGKNLCVDYLDDGTGMTPESLARVFDPFYSTDLQHGMGLGMHLVYNLITHRMGGNIQCESVLGQGVHFHIKIPL